MVRRQNLEAQKSYCAFVVVKWKIETRTVEIETRDIFFLSKIETDSATNIEIHDAARRTGFNCMQLWSLELDNVNSTTIRAQDVFICEAICQLSFASESGQDSDAQLN